MTEPRPVPADDVGDVPLSVLGVRVELPEQHHVILLVDPPGRTMVPLWVGAPEAAAAALALEGVRTPRPLTHELLLAAVDALGAEVVRVRLTEVRDEVVHAELVLSTGARVDARASDAVVVALRADAAARDDAELDVPRARRLPLQVAHTEKEEIARHDGRLAEAVELRPVALVGHGRDRHVGHRQLPRRCDRA